MSSVTQKYFDEAPVPRGFAHLGHSKIALSAVTITRDSYGEKSRVLAELSRVIVRSAREVHIMRPK